MDQTSITTAGAIDTFLVLLIGLGPKIALVPFLRDTSRTVDGLRRLRVPGDAHAPWGSASLIVDRRTPTGIAAADAALLMLNHPLWVKPDRSGET
jgi:hypothetical protein